MKKINSIHKSIRMQFPETILKISKEDKKVIVLVGDISHGIFSKFRELNPKNYYNVGINECAMVSMASGLSKIGYIPVVHTIAPFLIERTYEQIKLNFALQNQNINLVSIGSSFDYSRLGCTHHCYSDISILSHFKNAKIFIPGSADEFDCLFLKNYNKPGIKYFRIIENNTNFRLNKNNILKGSIKLSHGKDLTIVTLPSTSDKVLIASKFLKKKGINIDVIYVNCMKPFNTQVINDSISRTNKLLVVEDLSKHDGLLNLCLRSQSKIKNLKFDHIAIKDFIRVYGDYDTLCKSSGLTVSNIIKKSLEFFK